MILPRKGKSLRHGTRQREARASLGFAALRRVKDAAADDIITSSQLVSGVISGERFGSEELPVFALSAT